MFPFNYFYFEIHLPGIDKCNLFTLIQFECARNLDSHFLSPVEGALTPTRLTILLFNYNDINPEENFRI